MEEILRKLHKDASGNKYKAIRDGCAVACGESYTCQQPLLGFYTVSSSFICYLHNCTLLFNIKKIYA